MRRSAEKGNRIWRKNGKALRDCRLSCFCVSGGRFGCVRQEGQRKFFV